MHPRTMLLPCALAFLGAATSAGAQSEETLAALQARRPDAATRAEQELLAAERARGPDLPSLSLLVGFLRLSAGDVAGSAQQLLKEEAPPLLQAHHAYYLGEALFYLGHYRAASERFQAAARSSPPALLPRARARLGEALLASGDARGALPLLEGTVNGHGSAPLLLQRARAKELLGDAAGAVRDLRRLVVEHPLHPCAAEALERLNAASPDSLTFDERLARARVFAAAQPMEALEELDQLLARKLARTGPAQAKVALAAAQALFALGAVEEAEAQLELARNGAPETAAEALLLRARRALKGDDNAATRALMAEVVAAGPGTPAAEEAGYYLGWLSLQDDRFQEAAGSFADYLGRWKGSRRRDEAQWFRTLALLQLGRFPDARQGALALAGGSPRSPLVPQALYWAARAAQLGGGEVDEVARAFQQVVDQFPASFYALLSRGRLKEMGRPSTSGLPALAEDGASPPPLPPPLEVVAALRGAGLFGDAEQEAEAQARAARSASQALALGAALGRLGYPQAAYALANRWLWNAAFTERRPEALALFYPRAYQPWVLAQARASGTDPYLLWAVMRRESAFRTGEASGANARGLMQIVPGTAAQISRRLSMRAPEADELYLPELNIRLAAWYLAALQKRFQHPVLVAAAYNAGPNPVLRWIREKGDLPLDLFVETIAYRETRGYVRQVVADLLSYRALYERQAVAPLNLALPTPLEDGVDF